MSNVQPWTNAQHTARIRLFEASVQLALLQFSLYVVQSSIQPWTNAQHTARIRLFKASPQLTLLQFSLYVVQSSVRMCPCMRACRSTCSTVLFCSLKNVLDRILVLSRTNNLNYPRCHLEFTIKLVRLAGYQHIPGKWRMPTRRRILWMNDKSIWLRPQRSIWQLVSHLILSTTGSL